MYILRISNIYTHSRTLESLKNSASSKFKMFFTLAHLSTLRKQDLALDTLLQHQIDILRFPTPLTKGEVSLQEIQNLLEQDAKMRSGVIEGVGEILRQKYMYSTVVDLCMSTDMGHASFGQGSFGFYIVGYPVLNFATPNPYPPNPMASQYPRKGDLPNIPVDLGSVACNPATGAMFGGGHWQNRGRPDYTW
jgi:hypothetical protein